MECVGSIIIIVVVVHYATEAATHSSTKIQNKHKKYEHKTLGACKLAAVYDI